jgi:ribonuclease Z
VIILIDICLLGCGGSMPVPYRYLTSLLINYKGKKILVDCGEGTQVSMKIVGWGFKSVDIICFTHSHADHVIGLPGLLLTIANSGRLEPLTIIGPSGFKQIVEGLMVVCPYLPFEVNVVEVSVDKNLIYNFEGIDIGTIPADHTVNCISFSFNIKRARRFDVDSAAKNKVPKILWSKLQKGELVVHEGKEYTPDMVLGEERKGLKISYCTDTRPFPELIDFVKDSNLLIAEGMYGDDADLEKAINNKHMLFSEAAEIAKTSSSKELWLTHFSPIMMEPSLYIDNAKAIFDNVVLGEDRLLKSFDFKGL